jgi:adenine-specific DNA-methyltransferase
MAHLDTLINRIADSKLRSELQVQVSKLAAKTSFGLVFEEHRPESVVLPGLQINRGDRVTFKDRSRPGMWTVMKIDGEIATMVRSGDVVERETAPLQDLTVTREFGEPIFPGLRSVGKIERGDDKPFHTVINAENFHALQTLLYTHRARIDAIYIDPPYNTGAKDWKYNNDYVDDQDMYRHSKWLAFMQRRLLLAKELLRPENSVLICTIDEKEVHRLGLLLEQTFPGERIQMVSTVISSQASVRDGLFSRCDEYIYFVFRGTASVGKSQDDMLNEGLSSTKSQLWFQFVRTGKGNLRSDRKDMFYPIFADPKDGRIVEIGEPIPLDADKDLVVGPSGTVAIWPETADGREGRWRTGPQAARQRAVNGLLRLGKTSRKQSGWSVMSVNGGTEGRIANGEVVVEGRNPDGSAVLNEIAGNELRNPKTVWNRVSHNAGWHGSKLVAKMLPGRSFPYPKSLYAVEDTLRFFVKDKPDAVVLDFFSGSGTTAHAVMRLNRQDDGRRQSICVTNNEVSVEEQVALRAKGLAPGDPAWEERGIYEYVTMPRVQAAVSGETPDGSPISGAYTVTDEFPMSEGFTENVEFLKLTYEDHHLVRLGHRFQAIAPILWMRAGSHGTRIDDIPDAGWSVPDGAVYGLLTDIDHWEPFVAAVNARSDIRCVFIVTDSQAEFEAVNVQIDQRIDSVRLYSDYLQTFEINTRQG